MNPNQTPMTCGCDCSCKHHYVGPVATILIGLAALASNPSLGYISPEVFSLTWPFLLIVMGISHFCKCCGCK